MSKAGDAAPADVPLLDLDTLVKRPTIRIDGHLYELLSPDELSVFDSHRFAVWGREINAIGTEGSDDGALAEKIELVARKVMVGVPDDLFARLSPVKKLAVVEVFTGLLARAKLGVAGALWTIMAMGATGAISSPGSSDSTAAPPCGGSTNAPSSS